MVKRFKRDICALDDVFGFVDGFLSALNASDTVAFTMRIAAEELFTNLIKHDVKMNVKRERGPQSEGEGQPGSRMHESRENDITISLEKNAGMLVMRLTDFGVEPARIQEIEKVDVTLPLQERKIGGLGIHLVRSLVDELTYEYKDGNLSVTATKTMESKDV